MSNVQATMLQASMRAEILRERANTIESVLCDYAAFYRGAEAGSLEEIREGLGILMDKLQRSRKQALDSLESVNRLVGDLQVRLREEPQEASG